MPEIYYTGGTAQKNISSKDIIKEISNSIFVESRAKALGIIIGEARRNDTIIIMGARDNTLTDFAKEIIKCLS
jgi:UDP-N-acetylmuramate--alanine ligase